MRGPRPHGKREPDFWSRIPSLIRSYRIRGCNGLLIQIMRWGKKWLDRQIPYLLYMKARYARTHVDCRPLPRRREQMPTMMSGKRALLEMLKAEGVEYIFGNPGTSEGPIIDLLGDYPQLKYILTLQESVAVGMGEAYARATQKAA